MTSQEHVSVGAPELSKEELREIVLHLTQGAETLGELFERLGLSEEEALEIQQQLDLSGNDWLDMLTFKSRDSIIQMVFMYMLMILAAIGSMAFTNAFIVEKGCTPPEFLSSSLGVFATVTALTFVGLLAFNMVREVKRRKTSKTSSN